MDEVRNIIAITIASLVEADEFSLDYGNHDIIGLLAREYRKDRNVAGSYVAVPGEALLTGNPGVFETRHIITVWWSPDDVLIEHDIRDHNDLLCSWKEAVMTRDEFVAHVRETAKKLGLDVAWEDYE